MAQAQLTKLSVGLNVEVTLKLDETEARALEAIFGYSADAFLKAFYEKMGIAYVKPHEAGVRSLHETIRSTLAGPLARIDETRQRIGQRLNP